MNVLVLLKSHSWQRFLTETVLKVSQNNSFVKSSSNKERKTGYDKLQIVQKMMKNSKSLFTVESSEWFCRIYSDKNVKICCVFSWKVKPITLFNSLFVSLVANSKCHEKQRLLLLITTDRKTIPSVAIAHSQTQVNHTVTHHRVWLITFVVAISGVVVAQTKANRMFFFLQVCGRTVWQWKITRI